MNIKKQVADIVLTIAMGMLTNGFVILENFLGLGWEAEHKKRKKSRRNLYHLSKMEESNAFPDKSKGGVGSDLLVMQ